MARRPLRESDLIRAIRTAQQVSTDFVVSFDTRTGRIEIAPQAIAHDRSEVELLQLARRHGYG